MVIAACLIILKRWLLCADEIILFEGAVCAVIEGDLGRAIHIFMEVGIERVMQEGLAP